MTDEVAGLVQAPHKHLEDVLQAWSKDPERAVLGINTPVDDKIWGTILGKHYDPTVSTLGGMTEGQKQDAERSGINMGLARPMYQVANAVALYYAMGGGAGGGAGAATEGAAAGAGEGAATAGGSLGGSAATGGAYTTAAADSAAVGGSAYAGSVPASVNLVNAGGTVAAGGSAAAGSSLGTQLLKSGAQSAASSLLSKAMTPKPKQPQVKPPPEMPDPLAQEQARRRKLMEQVANRGRASTILTNSSGTLGG